MGTGQTGKIPQGRLFPFLDSEPCELWVQMRWPPSLPKAAALALSSSSQRPLLPTESLTCDLQSEGV